jgi:tetraacyldisaccharide 4'-kinase
VVILRNIAFDLGILRRRRVAVPVISVGNLTAGGTGKTPLVELLVGRLLSQKKKPVVVSRGYGRQSRGVLIVSDGSGMQPNVLEGGDEPSQMARRFPSVGVVVGEKRVDAALRAARDLRPDVIVLDDGFQHRYLERDLDIVVLDARTDITREPLLPAGRRREPLESLKRANLVVISYARDTRPLEWETSVRLYVDAPIVRCRYVIRTICRLGSRETMPLPEMRQFRFAAFSGIGSHRGFVDDLRALGMSLVAEQRFPDHHWYTAKDLSAFVSSAKGRSAEAIITTEKDAVRIEAVRISDDVFGELPVFYTQLSVEVLDGDDVLSDALERCLKKENA